MLGPAAIFILGAIASIVLPVLNGPMPSNRLEELLHRGLMLPEATDGMANVLGRLPDLAFSHVLHGRVDAQQPSRARQTDVRRINRAMPQAVGRYASVLFLTPLKLRGERRPAGAAGLWPGHWVDWLLVARRSQRH